MKKIINNILKFFKSTYTKLFKIDASPQKIALGFGLGVFLGILPGTGPIAAVFLAFLLRLNKASALLGSTLTNTWLSIATFFLSIKVGSAIMHLNWRDTYHNTTKIISILTLGYLIIGLCSGLLAYLIVIIALRVKSIYSKKYGEKNE